MTPEEARALEPGTTPGPWEWKDNCAEGLSSRAYDSLGNDTHHALETWDGDSYASWVVASDEDKALIAAAPDMRATIAVQTWEYRIEEWGGNYWYPCAEWDGDASLFDGYTAREGERLVRRPVGPVEVVEP